MSRSTAQYRRRGPKHAKVRRPPTPMGWVFNLIRVMVKRAGRTAEYNRHAVRAIPERKLQNARRSIGRWYTMLIRPIPLHNADRRRYMLHKINKES
jgi:hypothetical protein